MANFAAVSDIEAFLQISISDADKIIAAERALTEASAQIRIYTRQYIEQVIGETIEIDSPGTYKIYLPEIPVTEITQVIEDETVLTVETDYKLGESRKGILHRIGRRWAPGILNIAITYTHGFADIPQAIKDICTRAASRAYQAGLKTESLAGVPGVTAKSLGDYSVSFAENANEGVLGASGANLLLMSEKQAFDYYRIDGP